MSNVVTHAQVEKLAFHIGKKLAADREATRKEIEALKHEVADLTRRLDFVIAPPADDERTLPQ